MKAENLKSIQTYLETCGQSLPSYMAQSNEDLYVSLYIAKQLENLGEKEEAYRILKAIYEAHSFEYDKNVYGIYEDYVEEKTKFLEALAALNLEITMDLKTSIIYINEALDLLDGEESIAPYVDIRKIKQIKQNYVSLLFKNTET